MPKATRDETEGLPQVEIQPLTPARWADFEQLFGSNGACAGCWCMWWRERQGSNAGNKAAMHAIVEHGPPPGLLAYAQLPEGPQAVGWLALAPRADYSGLARSRLFKPLDARPVWCVTCFFIRKDFRKRGLTLALLRAAVDYARAQGAPALEAYPHEPAKPEPGAFLWTGLASTFRAAGFTEAARPSPRRPIMRLELK